jgi:hypothetical protein
MTSLTQSGTFCLGGASFECAGEPFDEQLGLRPRLIAYAHGDFLCLSTAWTGNGHWQPR